MTLIDPDAADLMAPIQYRNLADAIVTVRDVGQPANVGLPNHHYSAECGGCLENLGVAHPYALLSGARKWAREHARSCAALPRFVPGGDMDRTEWTSRAEEYAKRAVRLLEGKTAVEGATAHPIEARNPIDCARQYATIADVYARLAEH
jgi:hypothetical protein